MIGYISGAIIPILILCILLYGYIKKVDLYDSFITGAKEGVHTTIKVFPCLLAMICAVSVFRASGLTEIIVKLSSKIFDIIGFKSELLPIVIFRPLSGSGATAVLIDIFKKFTPDSFIGLAASVMMGSTETTFYIISVYLGSNNIKDYSAALKACVLADIIGFVGAYIISLMFFK